MPLTSIILCATDGAPSMVDYHHRFLSYLKKAVPKVLTVHRVIHRQHLVAKNLSEKLHESFLTVITAVNKIKVNALNSRLFHQLCIENDKDFQCLLLHTEVRWLSKGDCLKKFYTLFNSVLDIFQESNPELYDKLKDSYCLPHWNVFQIQWSEFAAARWWDFINQSQICPLGIPLKITALQQEPWTPRIPSVSIFVWLGEENRSEGRWHCCVLRSFSGTLQGYVSQIQQPIFFWNPWLGDRSIYWTQHRGANPSRRGTCKFAKWRGSETKVQNLLPSLLDANSDPKMLPNPVERHQVVFYCFSDFLPCWEGIQCCVQAPH